jgi:hypothetical protein
MKHKKEVIYQVSFLRTRQTEFYRQLKSIYIYHTRDEIGCKVGHLYDSKIEYGKPFMNRNVKIEVLEVK